MDKTLSDYITRTLNNLKKDQQEDSSVKENSESYKVYPEDEGHDRFQNPYGEH